VSPEPAAARAELIAVLDNMRQRYERSFVAIRDRARLIEIELATDIAVGPPEEQILHMADSIQASLIPIGRPSHSAFHRWMLGSNPLRYVRCPVMGVHGDAESPS
jgi:nucleotide-binding universal stress UspA family protein